MVALATGSTSLAGQLDAQQRQDLAVVVLVGGCVTDLARQNEVSRKFIYQQKEVSVHGNLCGANSPNLISARHHGGTQTEMPRM